MKKRGRRAIRDWNGNIVRSFSRSIDSSDANKTELFTILIGCRKLLQMRSYSVVLEGDSFTIIQWYSESSSHS